MEQTKQQSRRKFLSKSAQFSAVLPFLGSSTLLAQNNSLAINNAPRKPLKILILGGTGFLGPHQVAYALSRGHSVTTFTRGKTQPTINKEAFKEVEALVGDREDNLEALKNREWDVVIDNSGRRVKWTKDTAELLTKKAQLYLYVSSVSAYYPFTGTDFSEDRKVVLSVDDKDLTEDNKRQYEYGMMKANSELAAIKAFGEDRTTVVRPTFIVGPGNPQDRFVHWAIRLAKGGETLIPGKQTDTVQYIDVRDLARWMIHLMENRIAGTFNGAGPASPMSPAAFVHGAHGAFGTPISYTYIDDYDFLKAQNLRFLCPWVMPDGVYAGMCRADNTKALANGLTITPLAKTMEDLQTWWYSDAVSEERRANLLAKHDIVIREEAIIKAWKGK